LTNGLTKLRKTGIQETYKQPCELDEPQLHYPGSPTTLRIFKLIAMDH